MKNVNRSTVIIASSALVIGLLLGWLLFGGSSNSKGEALHISDEKETIWTCSMHPQIRKNEPGDCPICGMDLVPLTDESETLDPNSVKMTATAMQLAQVQTMVVGASKAQKSVRLSGKVQADERAVYSQPSHIAGRIEELKINFTGDFVKQGQVIAMVYSPELVTAQKELLEASKIQESQPALF